MQDQVLILRCFECALLYKWSLLLFAWPSCHDKRHLPCKFKGHTAIFIPFLCPSCSSEGNPHLCQGVGQVGMLLPVRDVSTPTTGGKGRAQQKPW
jgi:hypothetical protein